MRLLFSKGRVQTWYSHSSIHHYFISWSTSKLYSWIFYSNELRYFIQFFRALKKFSYRLPTHLRRLFWFYLIIPSYLRYINATMGTNGLRGQCLNIPIRRISYERALYHSPSAWLATTISSDSIGALEALSSCMASEGVNWLTGSPSMRFTVSPTARAPHLSYKRTKFLAIKFWWLI